MRPRSSAARACRSITARARSAARVIPSRAERVVPAIGPVQLRLEQPLVMVAGDRFVVRQIAPPDTIGGGVVLAVGTRPDAADVAEAAVRRRGFRAAGTGSTAGCRGPASGAAYGRSRTAGLGELADRAGATGVPRLEKALACCAESEGAPFARGPELFFDADALDAGARGCRWSCARDGAVTIAAPAGRARHQPQVRAGAARAASTASGCWSRVGDEHRLRRCRPVVHPNRAYPLGLTPPMKMRQSLAHLEREFEEQSVLERQPARTTAPAGDQAIATAQARPGRARSAAALPDADALDRAHGRARHDRDVRDARLADGLSRSSARRPASRAGYFSSERFSSARSTSPRLPAAFSCWISR